MADRADSERIVSDDAAELLHILRDGVPRTRAELAQMTGLARSTIAVRLDALTRERLITAAGDGVSSGGRPPSQIVFNPSARTVLAIDLGATHSVIALTDLAGNILCSESHQLKISDGPRRVLDEAMASATTLMSTHGVKAGDLVGIGIGVPGPVEHTTGTPISPPIMPGWDGFVIPEYVEGVLGARVLVDNDVNLLALGERARAWPDHDDLLFVKIATGIGAGIMSSGVLQRGAQGSAGDLGHVRVPVTPEGILSSDAFGDELEAVASGPAIARALTQAGISATTSADVVALAQTGNPDVLAMIRAAGKALGEVLATCVNLLNPSIIVIGGSLSRVGEQLLAGVREVVYQRSTPLATRNLTITESRSGETGGAVGAALMVIHDALDPSPAGRNR